MQTWRRRSATTLAALALAGVTMGQQSCEESAKEFEKSADAQRARQDSNLRPSVP